MRYLLSIITLVAALAGCADVHRGTLVVYDAQRVVVRDAVLANRSNEAIRAMSEIGTQSWGSGEDNASPGNSLPFGAALSSGVILIRPGEVELERVIGWNWGVEGIDVAGSLRELEKSPSQRPELR